MQIRVFSLFFTSDQRNWPNARAFEELRTHLVTVGRIDQMCSAFGQKRSARTFGTRVRFTKRCEIGQCRTFDQLVKCAARLRKCADWSNAPYSHTIFVFNSIITSMARNSLLCADVPLRNYSLTHLQSHSIYQNAWHLQYKF